MHPQYIMHKVWTYKQMQTCGHTAINRHTYMHTRYPGTHLYKCHIYTAHSHGHEPAGTPVGGQRSGVCVLLFVSTWLQTWWGSDGTQGQGSTSHRTRDAQTALWGFTLSPPCSLPPGESEESARRGPGRRELRGQSWQTQGRGHQWEHGGASRAPAPRAAWRLERWEPHQAYRETASPTSTDPTSTSSCSSPTPGF